MHIEIYSKDSCGQCVQAKNMIKQKCYGYDEYILGKDVTIEDLQNRVKESNSNKPLRTAPQIFIDGNHLGAFDDLVTFLRTADAACDA